MLRGGKNRGPTISRVVSTPSITLIVTVLVVVTIAVGSVFTWHDSSRRYIRNCKIRGYRRSNDSSISTERIRGSNGGSGEKQAVKRAFFTKIIEDGSVEDLQDLKAPLAHKLSELSQRRAIDFARRA